jgi:hypothetical protein
VLRPLRAIICQILAALGENLVSSVSCVFCVVIHLHVISRFRGDGFGFHFGPEYARLLDRSVLDQVALDIR